MALTRNTLLLNHEQRKAKMKNPGLSIQLGHIERVRDIALFPSITVGRNQ